jgi:dTDP-4-amino-4,6-dideoxygalactose transaminase
MAERIYGEREQELLSEVLASGKLGALDGKFTPRFEAEFARTMGAKYCVAMNCAMSVLHSSVICAGAGAGDEVICDPVFIFGALAALYNNALPKFVDINPVTHNMDPDKIEKAITERTKAVIVTHAWGLPAEMDRIVGIAHQHNLLVIEDCAHSILATYKGRYTGSWGDIGSFSFQASKQMSLGDGGMATTNNEELAKKLDLNAGAPTFQAVAYGLHYNYRMNELTSAVGIAQLERLPKFIEGLQKNASYYNQAIIGCKWLVPQQMPGAVHTYHYWTATFDGEKQGLSLSEFTKALKEANLPISVGYTQMPAYRHPVIKERLAHAFHCKNHLEKVDYPDGICPIAERVIPRMVLAYTVGPEEQAKESAKKFNHLIKKMEG